jgi:hypothetical protein
VQLFRGSLGAYHLAHAPSPDPRQLPVSTLHPARPLFVTLPQRRGADKRAEGTGAAMPRLYGLRRRQAALAPTRAALVLAMGLLLGAMLTMLLQTAGEVSTQR